MSRILIVDDDVNIVEYLGSIFSNEGYEVVTCDGGEKAIEIAAYCRPDLIVLDAMMPRIDGYQVLWHLHDRAITRNIPTIMLTSRTRAQDVEFGLKLGADAYLPKPFSIEEILSNVSKLLNREELKQNNTSTH